MGRVSNASRGVARERRHARSDKGPGSRGTASGDARAADPAFAALPGSPLKAVAAGLVESEHPGMVVVALAALVQDYCYGSDPSAGAVMADALHQRARELWRIHRTTGSRCPACRDSR